MCVFVFKYFRIVGQKYEHLNLANSEILHFEEKNRSMEGFKRNLENDDAEVTALQVKSQILYHTHDCLMDM